MFTFSAHISIGIRFQLNIQRENQIKCFRSLSISQNVEFSVLPFAKTGRSKANGIKTTFAIVIEVSIALNALQTLELH